MQQCPNKKEYCQQVNMDVDWCCPKKSTLQMFDDGRKLTSLSALKDKKLFALVCNSECKQKLVLT